MELAVDLLVIGAGPAGLAAAAEAAGRGLRTVVLDEYFRAGGRLLGQLYQNPETNRWWNGVTEAEQLVQTALEAGVEIRLSTQVWGAERLESGWRLYLVHPDGSAGQVEAPALLLATGAGEKPLALPGWTLPGVMTAGAAQVMANLHRVRPGGRALIVGVGPLAFSVAHELLLAGVKVAGIALPPPGLYTGAEAQPQRVLGRLAQMSHLAPSALLRLLGPLARWAIGAWLGIRLYPPGGWRIWGVPLWLRQAAVEILGEERVEGVALAPVSSTGVITGPARVEQVDLVLLAGGLYPVGEIAAAAGCPMIREESLGGSVPLHGPHGETPIPGLFVAGNITGVEGAPVAIWQGRLAGLAISAASNRCSRRPTGQELSGAEASVEAARRSALIQFQPGLMEGRAHIRRRWAEYQAKEGAG